MTRSRMRTLWPGAFALVAIFCFTMQSGRGLALAAGTAPATVISNTATATYSDGNGVSYTTNSNTVTTTVQNAPSLTIAPPAPQTVAPGQVVVDSYVLTNTGNAAGTFSIPTGSPATVGPNGAFPGSGAIYVVAGTTCTAAAPCTLAQANTALAGLAPTAPGGTLTIGVEYGVLPTDTAGNTIPTTLTAVITQAATTVGTVTVPAATSASVTQTVTDTVAAQARLDLQKTITPATGVAPAPIGFTITANDGGGFAATDLQSVKSLLGSPAAGILITDAIPSFGAPAVPLTLSGTPTDTVPAGTTGTIYYSTSATGAAGSWSTTYAAGDYFIGVLVSGGAGGVELPSAPTGSTGAGAVTTPQVTLKFSVDQPAGTGSADTGSISNLANSVIGGRPGASGLTPVIGPNIPAGTVDVTGTPSTPLTTAIDNTTPGTGAGAPGGASNKVFGSAFSTASVLIGPADAAAATGSYPAAPNNGAATATNFNDFTAVSFACAATTVTGTACTVPSTGITVPGTYQNTGNAADTLSIAVTVPAGFTATIYNATCPATIPAGSNIQTVCTATGAAIGTGSGTATATGTATGSFGSVNSGASGNYVVVYTPIAGAPAVANGVGIDAIVSVSGTSGDTNRTHDDLYPGGPLALNKSAAVVTNCPGTGQTAGGICPGGTLTYTVGFANQAPANAVGANVGTEPAYAYAGIQTSAVVITEDGTGANAATASNNWATFTNGLVAAPTVTNTTGTTTFSFVYTPSGAAAGATKFTATATSIAPGAAGTIVFSAIVK